MCRRMPHFKERRGMEKSGVALTLWATVAMFDCSGLRPRSVVHSFVNAGHPEAFICLAYAVPYVMAALASTRAALPYFLKLLFISVSFILMFFVVAMLSCTKGLAYRVTSSLLIEILFVSLY